MIYTLVPLGNPGSKYEKTRHNIGRIIIDLIKDDIIAISACEIFVPETFMNESGSAVLEYLKYHEGRELIVIYDDKDLAFGRFRISHDRGDGGHNGVKSIIASLGTKEFTRIRIGIAPHDTDGNIVKPPHGDVVQDYVMGKVTEDEETSIRTISADVLGAIKTITEEGYKKAMEKYN
jgi:peptidyl-tRNA hydrolase, PTH1 family